MCLEWQEFVIPGVIFSQTSIDGDLNFVRNSGVSARQELTVTRNPLTGTSELVEWGLAFPGFWEKENSGRVEIYQQKDSW